MSLGWCNDKSPLYTLLCYISTPNYWTLNCLFLNAIFVNLTLARIPLLLGMFPSRTPLRERFSSPACPGLVSWLPVVRAQGPGGCPHRHSHTSVSAYAVVLTGITFASLFTFLSPYLQALLWSLPLQTNIQAFSLYLPISAGGCSPQRVISTSQAFLTIWKIFFASWGWNDFLIIFQDQSFSLSSQWGLKLG